MYWLF